MYVQKLPTIEISQDNEQKDWQWNIRHPQTGALLGSSADRFYDRQECVENLKFFGRMITAFAVAQEGMLQAELELSA